MTTGPLAEVRPLYRARYARDGDGWRVEIVEDPRVHSEGDTLAQARERILDALATWLDSEVSALPPVRDVLELPAGVDVGQLDEALSHLPPGRYVIGRLDEATELMIEEDAGVEEALRSDERGESVGVEELRKLLRKRRE